MPVVAALLLAAAPVQVIRYETSPCFGFCAAYVVTVSSDGHGVFEPTDHSAFERPGRTGARERRTFVVTPAQFAAFAARLRPVRPNGEVLIDPGSRLCGISASDSITVDVRWTGGPGDPRHLRYYWGCEHGAELRKSLEQAPATLPIADLIGRR